MPDDITPNGLTDGGNQPVADGTVSEGGAQLMDLSELNQLLGKNFPTKDAALKSIKDTFSYTGQVGQLRAEIDRLKGSGTSAAPSSNDSELASTVRALQEQLEENTFFNERPDLKEYQSTLREMSRGTGKSMSEIANSEAFKPLFEKALLQDAAAKKRSVLESNPRLGQVRDKFQEARTALKEGNRDSAVETSISAVLDAYDLSK
jgi:hypothetical protein